LANVPEHLVPDFTVYTAERRPVFIEFWGIMDDPNYQQRRLRKCECISCAQSRAPYWQVKVVSLGIIRDAESEPAITGFETVCAHLKRSGLTYPNAVGSFSVGTPQVGVYILPNCRHPGMLETLCWSVLEANSKLV